MSSSTDSLKKKVCVTVFLDELFEEVLEEDWRELRQVSEITESEVKVAEKPYSEPSRIDLDNDEKVNVSPNADSEQSQSQLRPRKHRRESKFSENHCNSFENELTRYDYGSGGKTENENRELVESSVSESDFDLDEFLELDKWGAQSRSSFSDLSELELKDEGFPVLSPALIQASNDLKSNEKSSVSSCNKSIQLNAADLHVDSTDERIGGDDCAIKKQQKTADDVLAWKETQRRIHLILAKSRNREKETCEGDCLREYDLRSILEEWVKTDETMASKEAFVSFKGVRSNPSANLNESDVHDLSDSYTCVFPHNKRRNKSLAPEVKRVWTRNKRSAWNDGFESDLSEADCAHNMAGLGLCSFQKDALLSYTLCLKRNDKSEENTNSDTLQSVANSESTSRESSFESIKSKGSQEANLFFKTVTQLAKKTVLGANFKSEQEKPEEDTKNEGDFPLNVSPSLPATEGRNKNFAEGDTFEKTLNQDSKLILDFKAKEKLLVCDEILEQVAEPQIIHKEIIVNRAEVKLDSCDDAKKDGELVFASTGNQSFSAPEGLAEVFFKQNQFENLEKSVTDAESEMVFAESENFCENEDFFGDGLVSSLVARRRSAQNDVCVVEFEDKLSRSKILRRMKTVEILGDNSLNDMKNISTEVILICENISNNEVCLEAWQSSASTLRSFTETRQCYLKDSKDSAMYLIEIPLHFIHANAKKNEGDQFFKGSDSD